MWFSRQHQVAEEFLYFAGIKAIDRTGTTRGAESAKEL
jgi:hypothetical protein